ncbi:MAG: signal peptidase I, partial [Firmicutes bacterium]|nr:signal peptidase I [Bacillota bacterium]
MEDKEKVIPAEEGSVTEEEESDALKKAEEALTELEKKVSARTVALEWLKDILIAFVIAVVVLQFIKPTVVKQRSMEPNFYTNDYLFVSRQSYKLLGGDPERGDVIVFRSDLVTEDGRTKLLIKRVIGLPGDRVEIHDGKVFVNGEAIDDSYTMDQFT